MELSDRTIEQIRDGTFALDCPETTLTREDGSLQSILLLSLLR